MLKHKQNETFKIRHKKALYQNGRNNGTKHLQLLAF